VNGIHLLTQTSRIFLLAAGPLLVDQYFYEIKSAFCGKALVFFFQHRLTKKNRVPRTLFFGMASRDAVVNPDAHHHFFNIPSFFVLRMLG